MWMNGDTTRAQRPPSGRFIVRVDPELHASLRDAARVAGTSMNRHRCRHITAALVLGALLGLAGQTHAQRRSPEERYEDLKKTPWLAASLEWIVPSVGHDYAGDKAAAVPSALLMAGGVLLFMGAVMTDCWADPRGITFPALPEPDPDCEDRVDVVAGLGVFTVLASRIWASVSAWRLANRTNAYYRKRLGLDGVALSVTPARQFGLGVSLRF